MTLGITITLSYQDGCGKITNKEVTVDKNTVYKVTVADNNFGMTTFNGRISTFTVRLPEIWEEMPTYVDLNKITDFNVDTIIIDCSDKGQSRQVSINVGDIRSIEVLSTSGLDEIVNPVVPTFN
jgi:hypothetical protein